ncbi:unnamed protein product [Lathyrus sativus]|nr:unnamed protein product [Lathyrus sativus]
MLEIKGVNEEAFKHLIKIPPRFWSKSRFQPSSCCDTLVNNMSEAFNYVLVAARSKPIVIMLKEIRVYILQRWESNRKKVTKYDGFVLSNIKKRMEKESQKTNHWIVRRVCEYDYEVRHTSLNGEKYIVNLYKKECSCRLRMLTGLPYCHAIS